MSVGENDVDGIGGEGQDIFTRMKRWLPIFVLAGIIGVGPGALGWIHQIQMKQMALPRATLPTTKGAVPVKTTPTKPAHDPATCVICLLLHAPMASGPERISVGVLQPAAQIIWATVDSQIEQPFLSTSDCRGPPVA